MNYLYNKKFIERQKHKIKTENPAWNYTVKESTASKRSHFRSMFLCHTLSRYWWFSIRHVSNISLSAWQYIIINQNIIKLVGIING